MSEVLCDSHGHIQMLAPERRDEILSRARDAGVAQILIPGTTVEDSRQAVEVAEREAGLWAAVGVHPHEAKDFDPDRDFKVFEELLKSPKAVAIGEIGLDFHYDYSPRQIQIAALAAHLQFAASHHLPVLLHNRESGPAMMDTLRQFPRRPNPGLFHSFAESAGYGAEAIALGYKVSFSGMITFKAAENIRAAARDLPLAEMLVETDAPFLAPVPHRGKPCEPAFVADTARKLAEVKGVAAGEVARATTANFQRLVGRL